MATLAPSLARRRAQPRPMPCEAPVTRATRPERDIGFSRRCENDCEGCIIRGGVVGRTAPAFALAGTDECVRPDPIGQPRRPSPYGLRRRMESHCLSTRAARTMRALLCLQAPRML